MKNVQINKLMEHITAVSEIYRNREEKPYVKMELSTFSGNIEVRIKDKGIDAKGPYDGEYSMNIEYDCDRTYNNCINHLVDLECMADEDNRSVE